jgi:hypothetical protein
VFANAFRPDDILSNGSHLRRGDLILLESFGVRNGTPESTDIWFERARTAAAYRERLGVQVWTVTTPSAAGGFDPALCGLAWWATVLWGFDGFGWGEPDYAAPRSAMPLRTCAGEPAAALAASGAYVSAVARSGSRFTRQAETASVEVDFAARTGRLRPRGGVRTSPGIR